MTKLFGLLLLLLSVSVSVSGASFSCTDCEVFAFAVKSMVSNNVTVVTIQSTLLQYCSFLPASERDVCTKFVKTSVVDIIKYVQQYDDPDKVCQFLGYCSSQKSKVSNAVTCPACEYLVGLADTWLAENATEERIIGLFESACNIIPGDAKYVCRGVVDSYGKQIIELLINNEKPEKVCQILQLCASSKLQVRADPVPCYLCKYLIQTLEAFVTENTTEAEIIALADKICGVLPSSLRASCQSLVDIYIPQFVQYIIAKEDPSVICSAASLCSSRLAFQKTANVVRKIPADPQNCQLCQFIFLTLDGYLTSNATQQEILQYTTDLCAKLGGLAATCDALVNQELPTIIKYIISKADPTTACKELGVCPATKKMAKILKASKPKASLLTK